MTMIHEANGETCHIIPVCGNPEIILRENKDENMGPKHLKFINQSLQVTLKMIC